MWFLALLSGCLVQAVVVSPDDTGMETNDTNTCLVDPVIDHVPIGGPVSSEEDLLLDITAYDHDGLVNVEVRYRPDNTDGWRTLQADPVGGNQWQGIIDMAYLEPGTMEYFIRAYDTCGDRGCAPPECQARPWSFEVQAP